MELRAENISKIIHKKTILSNVNLELHNGTVYGFVGANGSGKNDAFSCIVRINVRDIRKNYLEWKSITS